MTPIISDETLFAYVDGELDAQARAEVEAAMAADPALAQRVEQQRSLRKLLGAAYAPVMDEAVPERLAAAARPPAKAPVLELAAARKRRSAQAAPAPVARDWRWKHWGGMAACLVIGVFAGRSTWLAGATDDIHSAGGQLVARASLAQALSTQLASTQPNDARVKLGLSFVSRADEYCRSFVMAGGTGGLACRQGDEWRLRVLAQDAAATQDGNLRMASSPVPPAVLAVVADQIKGSPLDAQAEREALQRGWRAR
jgi:anti-sigma-K factor RskA